MTPEEAVLFFAELQERNEPAPVEVERSSNGELEYCCKCGEGMMYKYQTFCHACGQRLSWDGEKVE